MPGPRSGTACLIKHEIYYLKVNPASRRCGISAAKEYSLIDLPELFAGHTGDAFLEEIFRNRRVVTQVTEAGSCLTYVDLVASDRPVALQAGSRIRHWPSVLTPCPRHRAGGHPLLPNSVAILAFRGELNRFSCPCFI